MGSFHLLQACFAVGVSGCISCVITKAEFLSFDSRSKTYYIFKEGGDHGQNYVEGLVIAALILLCSLASFLVFYFSKLPIYFGRDVLILVALSVVIVAGANIYEYYTIETSYYRMERLVPFPIWSWIVSPVKKSSGLCKRLLRVAWFTLTECSTWSEFCSKVDTIVIAYIKRTFLPQQLYDK